MKDPATSLRSASDTSENCSPRFSGEWKSAALPDVAVVRKGQLMTSSDLKPGHIPVIAGGKTPAYFHAEANRMNPCVTVSASGANAGYVALHREPIYASDCSTVEASRTITVEFAYYWLLANQDLVYNLQAGGAQPHVRPQDLYRLEIAYPHLSEQTAIAETLSDVDGLLGALEALIAKKQAIKQATMQQLLTGKTRLPGFSRKWDVKRLKDIASIRNHRIQPSEMAQDTLCIELDNIGQGNGKLLKYSTEQNSKSQKYRFFHGDVLFGRLRSYLRKFWYADRDGICTTEIWPLMVDPQKIIGEFLYAVVQSDRFIEAASISYGTHMPRADWGVMQNFEIRLPQVDEQRAIATILSDMDTEITALERRRDKTRSIKQGMMQQLLTGQVRLVKPE